MNYLSAVTNVILWVSWPFLFFGTIYILAKGRGLLNSVKGSIIGRLAVGLMIGFFIESYSILILCTAFLLSSHQNIYVVLPVLVVWFCVFVWSWRVMRKTRKDTEKATTQR